MSTLAAPCLFGAFPVKLDRFAAYRGLREHAFEAAQRQGLQTQGLEEWKYTSLRPIEQIEWQPGASEAHPEWRNSMSAFETGQSIRAVLINGRFRAELSNLPVVEGLEIYSLAEAIDRGLTKDRLGELASMKDTHYPVTAHLGQLNKPPMTIPAAINTASFEDGTFIRIAKGVQIDQPIEVVHIAAGASKGHCPRLLVVVEKDAKASIVESYHSADELSGWVNSVTEIFVEQQGSLQHVRFQDENQNSFHLGLCEVLQKSNSSYRSFGVVYGGRMVRNDHQVFLDGLNVHTRIDGVVCLDRDQHVDNHTRLDHAKPHGDSFEVYKHILNDRATAVFNGKVFVHEDAQKTDAKQTNQAILLSGQAVMNSKPQLEIFADDVKCTHGATIGQLRDDALFYMRSRGIDRDLAKSLLVYAFAAEVLEEIEDVDVKQWLERSLYAKLGTPID